MDECVFEILCEQRRSREAMETDCVELSSAVPSSLHSLCGFAHICLNQALVSAYRVTATPDGGAAWPKLLNEGRP